MKLIKIGYKIYRKLITKWIIKNDPGKGAHKENV
jgi:hypothetical protein